MRRPPFIGIAWLCLMAGCPKTTPASDSPADGGPEATPAVGPGRTGGDAQRTGAGNYEDPYGETKDPNNIIIDNQCSATVMLFFGQKPRPYSNYYTTMNGRSQKSSMMMPGDKAWIVDEDQNGIASTEIDLDSTEIIIDSSCDQIYAR